MKHGSLFSGIGGFDLAAEWMIWENIFHCEWNPFGQRVLKHYFPNAISYEDITKTDFTIHRGKIDILTGGFPCQPYSTAGKRKGKEDERHLWPEMLRSIREIRPRYIVGENVSGLVNWNGGMVFNEVQDDLEAEGYQITPFLLPAASLNAPHKRERIWFIAYSDSSRSLESNKPKKGWERSSKRETFSNTLSPYGLRTTSDTDIRRQSSQEHRKKESGWTPKEIIPDDWKNFPTQSPICDGNDGLSSRLDGITFPKWRNESIKGGGNAIVPQVALQIFKAIEEFNKLT